MRPALLVPVLELGVVPVLAPVPVPVSVLVSMPVPVPLLVLLVLLLGATAKMPRRQLLWQDRASGPQLDPPRRPLKRPQNRVTVTSTVTV